MVRADTIVFRTGEQLHGSVVVEHPALVIFVFDSEALGRIEIPHERIERLERDAASAAAPEPRAEAKPAPVKADANNTAESRDFLRFCTTGEFGVVRTNQFKLDLFQIRLQLDF